MQNDPFAAVARGRHVKEKRWQESAGKPCWKNRSKATTTHSSRSTVYDVNCAAVKYVELDSPEMTREFDSGYGGPEGDYFTAWGELYVYFPTCYDGAEWVDSVARHPCLIQFMND